MTAYLDNSATTSVCNEAIDKMCYCMKNIWGNPSSLHLVGIKADEVVVNAKENLSRALGVDKSEIYFTSGGTESNNLALRGIAHRYKKFGNKIVTTAIEHSSVSNTLDELEKEGFEVIRLSPKDEAKVTVSQLKEVIDEKTILVSVMAVNNEVGSIQPFDKIKKIITLNNSPAFLHIDAVQAFGKIPLKPYSQGVDLMTVSSHKIHGPKGVGALFIKDKISVSPIIYGGEQQKKVRPGTEPVPAIAGFGEAIINLPDLNSQFRKMSQMRDEFVQRLANISGVYINSPNDALPYIVNISLDRMRSETVLNFLSQMGIYVSSGSACAKGRKSYVLQALGLDDNRIDGAIRISMSRYTTKEELDYFIEGIKTAMDTLRKR